MTASPAGSLPLSSRASVLGPNRGARLPPGRSLDPCGTTAPRTPESMLIALWCTAAERGYASPSWMTFRRPSRLGGCVRKGETGTLVVYANSFTVDGTDSGDDGSPGRKVRFLKGYTVFNRDQIDDCPSPTRSVHRRDPSRRAYRTRRAAHEGERCEHPARRGPGVLRARPRLHPAAAVRGLHRTRRRTRPRSSMN